MDGRQDATRGSRSFAENLVKFVRGNLEFREVACTPPQSIVTMHTRTPDCSSPKLLTVVLKQRVSTPRMALSPYCNCGEKPRIISGALKASLFVDSGAVTLPIASQIAEILG